MNLGNLSMGEELNLKSQHKDLFGKNNLKTSEKPFKPIKITKKLNKHNGERILKILEMLWKKSDYTKRRKNINGKENQQNSENAFRLIRTEKLTSS